MKILVFMSDNRILEKNIETANYNSLTASINYEYCKNHNYDFIYYRPYLDDINNIVLNNCIDPNTNTERHAAWSKLLSTKLALQLNYDYIVYIDSDCIFKNWNIYIEYIIKIGINNDIIFFNNQPWNLNLPCSGFYICKNNLNTKKFLNDWYNTNISQNNISHAWEQNSLWAILSNYNIGLVDSLMFFEEDNQFLRHIGSCNSTDRIPYFQNFIKLKNINYSNISEIISINYDTRLDKFQFFENELKFSNNQYISNKTYSWKNINLTFLENSIQNFENSLYEYIDKTTLLVFFENNEYIFLFNDNYSIYKSINKNTNEIVSGYIV